MSIYLLKHQLEGLLRVGSFFRVLITTMLAVGLLSSTSTSADAAPVTTQRIDGKFRAKISPAFSTYGYTGSKIGAGFMKSAELELIWWGLLGQPVYYNTFTWTIRDEIKVELYTDRNAYISREKLAVYPDLLKRFDELRPSDIEITFGVTLNRNVFFGNVGTAENYYKGTGHFHYEKTIKSIELMIGRSGEAAENISNTSPTYREFTDNIIPAGRNPSQRDAVEKQLASTFRNAQSITFSAPYVSKLKLPNREIKDIYDLYMKRQAVCEEGLIKLEGRCIKLEEKTAKELPDADPWADGFADESKDNDPEPLSRATGDDWADGSSSMSNHNGIRATNEWADGFRVMPENDQSGNDWSGIAPPTVAHSSLGGDGWNDGLIADAQKNFKIIKDGDKEGVVSESGRLLIPFLDWDIISYKDGLAEVHQSEPPIQGSCRTRVNSSEGYEYTVTPKLSGYVDISGSWITPPERMINAYHGKHFSGILLTVTPTYKNAKDRERAEARAKSYERTLLDQMSDCYSEVVAEKDNVVRDFQARGYTLQ